jgi:16S rRNA (guanine(527)-N(7))-methyltransferase RsmG
MEPLEGLRLLIREYGISESSRSAHQLLSYLALLEKWNKRMNLTAATDWTAIESFFREGIWVSKIYPSEAVSHLDIGTGAGFPAIILKIFNPRILLDMVESRGKKSAFLETIAHSLGMNGTYVHTKRLDDYLQRVDRGKIWDCITWKGIKLSSSDLIQLREHAHSGTQFWMFHGMGPATEDPDAIESLFTLIRSEKLPTMKESTLSIYLPRH